MCAAAAFRSEALLPVGSFSTSYASRREFYHVGGPDLEKLDLLTEIFHRILTPLYGPQDEAIKKIVEGKDRSCFLLCENEEAVGVLVLKTAISDEFEELGVKASIEVKSLFVDHAAQNSGKGLGSALVDKLKQEVSKLNIGQKGIKGIHVTVSETEQKSLQFFQKKGFRIVHEWQGRYIKGVAEYLLACPWVAGQMQSIEKSVVQHLGRQAADCISTDLIDII